MPVLAEFLRRANEYVRAINHPTSIIAGSFMYLESNINILKALSKSGTKNEITLGYSLHLSRANRVLLHHVASVKTARRSPDVRRGKMKMDTSVLIRTRSQSANIIELTDQTV